MNPIVPAYAEHSSSWQDRRQRPKVVIIGGGFGGISAALSLVKANVDVPCYRQNLSVCIPTTALSSGNGNFKCKSCFYSDQKPSVKTKKRQIYVRYCRCDR